MKKYAQQERTGKAYPTKEGTLADVVKQRELAGKGVKLRVRAYIKEIRNAWDYNGIWQNLLLANKYAYKDRDELEVRMQAHDVESMITDLYANPDWWWWDIRWRRYDDGIWFEAIMVDRISIF